MLTDEQITDLLHRYRKGLCSDKEKDAVERWYRQLLEDSDWEFERGEDKLIGERIKSRLEGRLQLGRKKKAIPVRRLMAYAAALAALVAISSIAGYYMLHPGKPQQAVAVVPPPPEEDAAPGGNKATLTLANGVTITLDSQATGLLARQGNTRIIKLNAGQISYNGKAGTNQATLYNTLTTPRGGKYQITLSDGSKVWLNAASSITFPTHFASTRRTVSISGEAYFEIAPEKSGPFEVSVGQMKILVLGTHFNVMAYRDETKVKATLLEGSVKIEKGDTALMLKPGEQAQMNQSGQLKLVKNVNTDKAIAWKNDLFCFDRDDIHAVTNQLSRWYDVDVEIHGKITKHFSGTLPQHVNVSQIFKVLEETGGIHFRIDHHKIIVSP